MVLTQILDKVRGQSTETHHIAPDLAPAQANPEPSNARNKMPPLRSKVDGAEDKENLQDVSNSKSQPKSSQSSSKRGALRTVNTAPSNHRQHQYQHQYQPHEPASIPRKPVYPQHNIKTKARATHKKFSFETKSSSSAGSITKQNVKPSSPPNPSMTEIPIPEKIAGFTPRHPSAVVEPLILTSKKQGTDTSQGAQASPAPRG